MLPYPRQLLMACMIAAAPICARGADVAGGMEKLFAAGQRNAPPAVAAARQHAHTLKRASPKDVRIDYAYGVVLANQRRYDDAIRLLARYLKTQPRDFAAHQVKMWAEMQNKRYIDVLRSATAISKQLLPGQGVAPQDENVEMARFLGMVFAYFELVRSGLVDSQQLSKRKNALLARLGESYLTAFDEGRAAIAAKLEKLETERDNRIKRTQEAADRRKQQTQDALNLNRDKAATQQETIQASTEQLRDAQREFRLVQQRFVTLSQDRRALGLQFANVEAQMFQIAAENRDDDRVDSTGRFDIRDIDSPIARAQVTNLAIVLARLNVQIIEVDRKLRDLSERGALLTGRGRKEMRPLLESRAIAAKALKWADRLEKQITRSESGLPRLTTASVARMLRFSTYFPLPYEREKERVLGWFAQ